MFPQISYMAEGTVGSNKNTSETESILLVGLKPFTDYSITVTCENAAGPGNTSRPLIIRTNSCKYSIHHHTS